MDEGTEVLARGSYVESGRWDVSCEATDRSSTVPRSSFRNRLLDRQDASERERSRRARNPVNEWGDALRLWLDSREASWLPRVKAATRDRTEGRSPGMCGVLEFNC